MAGIIEGKEDFDQESVDALREIGVSFGRALSASILHALACMADESGADPHGEVGATHDDMATYWTKFVDQVVEFAADN